MMARMRRRIRAHRAAPRRRPLPAGATVTALVALALAACSVRLDTPPPSAPSEQPATVERDAAALREQRIVDAVAGAAEPETGQGEAAWAALARESATANLIVLGGVYVAYDVTPDASPPPSVAHAVREARDGAFASAWRTDDDNLANLLCAIGLNHALTAWYAGVEDARAAGVEVTVVAERPLAAAVPFDASALVPASSELSPTTLGALVVEHDRLRYMYETIAARSTGADRLHAYARMGLHADRAQALAELPGVPDARAPVYEILAADVTGALTQAATMRAAEQALGWRYATAIPGASLADRAWLLSAAFDAYAASAMVDGFTPSEFPILPGLDV